MSINGRGVVNGGSECAAGGKNGMSNAELQKLYTIVMREFDDWDKDYISRTDLLKKSPKFFSRNILRRYEVDGKLNKMSIGRGRAIYFLEDIKKLIHYMIFGDSDAVGSHQEEPAREIRADV
jgi:hypothetical protein